MCIFSTNESPEADHNASPTHDFIDTAGDEAEAYESESPETEDRLSDMW